jgi:hypothetical protein
LVGTQQWRPISDWADFGSSVPPPLPPELVQPNQDLSPGTSSQVPSVIERASPSASPVAKVEPRGETKPVKGLGLIALCVLSLMHLLKGCGGPTTEPQQPPPTGSPGKQVSNDCHLDLCDFISANVDLAVLGARIVD